MNVKTKFVLLILSTFSLNGCANMSFKQKIATNMAIGAAVGILAGIGEKEHKKELSLMYAGLAASGAALATIYVTDPSSDAERLRGEMAKMQADFDAAMKPQVEAASSGLMNSKVPEKYKAMINPGEWVIYSMDQWVEESENKLIHQDKMMELIPPSLKAQTLPMKIKRNN
ncbi:MAG: hypothetical protein H7336_15360 [Bacteriovorax sp.]|nr:hypothetical protein [Bacteriovorax sp.]